MNTDFIDGFLFNPCMKSVPNPWLILLTLAVAAVPAEIAAAGVLQLAVALGADADHVGHDGAHGFLVRGVLGLLFARYGARGVGEILDAPNSDHDALCDCLFR